MSGHLRFSIEESVWFQKGQEIDDILSISLEPDIIVDEYVDYVLIKGTLRLNGEYRPNEREEEISDKAKVFGEQLSYRSVQEVTMSDRGTFFFQHRFPVDITIPISRVGQLDDIYIQVESFDYRLPNKQCLQLTADLAITGIREEETIRKGTEDTDTNEERLEMFDIDLSDQVSFEMRVRKEDDIELETSEQEKEELLLHEEDVESRQIEQMPQIEMKGREEESEEEKPDLSASDENAIVSLAQAFEQSDSSSDDTSARDETEAETEEIEADNEIEEVEDNREKTMHRNDNALYLTKMLARDEERFSKLRMCIIQPGDSLNSIAERYDVSPGYLIRINRLEQEEVEEGQILYIPVTTGN